MPGSRVALVWATAGQWQTDVDHAAGVTIVAPIGDTREHMPAPVAVWCWCRPSFMVVDGRLIVSHNSADGRELVERHGIN